MLVVIYLKKIFQKLRHQNTMFLFSQTELMKMDYMDTQIKLEQLKPQLQYQQEEQ